MTRVAIIVTGSAAGYILLLVLLGFLLSDCIRDRVRQRIAESLQAEVTIEDASVSLLRGKVELRGVKIERRTGGHVTIDIDRIDAAVARFGWALIDGDPKAVAVRGAEMTLSGRGVLAMRDRDAPPLDVERFELEDVRIAIMPTTLLPRLGRLELVIDRARTGKVSMRSGVSWIFKLEELVASAAVNPGDISVSVGYADQKLSLGGSVLGSRPISFRFILPEVDPDKFEIAQLADLASQLAKQLVKEVAGDWIKRNLLDRVD